MRLELGNLSLNIERRVKIYRGHDHIEQYQVTDFCTHIWHAMKMVFESCKIYLFMYNHAACSKVVFN